MARTSVQYDVLGQLDAIEYALTPDVPFYVLHLIRACRTLQAERDGYRQALADALAGAAVRERQVR